MVFVIAGQCSFANCASIFRGLKLEPDAMTGESSVSWWFEDASWKTQVKERESLAGLMAGTMALAA
jgi:hypothetical protein